jgi:hypothetical protein
VAPVYDPPPGRPAPPGRSARSEAAACSVPDPAVPATVASAEPLRVVFAVTVLAGTGMTGLIDNTARERSVDPNKKKLKASKVIEAPAEDIFALLADPNRHSDIDGAGMLQGTEGDSPAIAGIGQKFTMNMHDPEFGDYRIVNSVTAYMPVGRIGWAPQIDPTCELAGKLEMDVRGHTYTYDLREVDGGTEVTQSYEWNGVKDPEFEKLFPRVSREQLAATLDRIAEAVR